MTDDHVQIETPEHIHVQYELAGIGSRALAGIFDALIQGLITLLVVWALIWLGLYFKVKDAAGLVGGIVIATTGFLAATAYYVISEMVTGGQSPGKRMAGLRVIGADGRPLTFLQSVLRNLLRAVDMLPLFYTVGLLSVFFSNQAQRLGDMVAGTIVVKERLQELPEGFQPLEDEAKPAPLPPEVEARLRTSLHLLSAADLMAAERVVERRHELAPDVRSQLVRQVAQGLLGKLPQVQATDFPDLEAFLEAVVRVWRERPL